MAQKTYAGITVDVNEEGYFTNPSQWSKDQALKNSTILSVREGLLLLPIPGWA